MFPQKNDTPFQLLYSSGKNGLAKQTVATDFQVNQNIGPRGADQTQPKVTFAMGFIAIWNDARRGDHISLYKERVVDEYGGTDANNIYLDNDLIYSQHSDISFDLASQVSDYIISWSDKESRNIYFQRFSWKDEPVGEALQVNDSPPISCWSFHSPSVSTFQNGDFIIAWEESLQGIGKDIYFQRYSKDGEKIGSNVKVNNDTTYLHPVSPVVSSGVDGSFVVVWLSYIDFGIADAIFSQSFSAEGLPISELLRIDQVEGEEINYSNPSIARLLNGNYIIVWVSDYYDNDSTRCSRIFSQIISKNGEKIGDNFIINDDNNITTHKFNPSVEVDLSGNIIIVWAEHRTIPFDSDIFVQLYSEDGSPVGSNIIANDSRAGRQEHPSVCINQFEDPYWDFVVAWDDQRNGYDRDIYTQIFRSDGSYYQKNKKINSDEGSSIQRHPSISIDKKGKFIISWWDDRDGIGNIYAQQFTHEGEYIRWNFRVSTGDHTVRINNPALCTDNLGNFIVTWTGNEWIGEQIFTQKYLNNCTPEGNNINITNEQTWRNKSSDIGCDSTGNYYVSWCATDDTFDDDDIFLKKFFKSGPPYASLYKVNDDEGDGNQGNPVIAANNSGDFSIAWEDKRENFLSDIYFQPYSNIDFGSKIGNNVKVNDDDSDEFSHLQPDIATDDYGNTIITWTDNRNQIFDIYAQRYSKEGLPLGGNFKVNDDDTFENHTSPSIAADDEGKFIIVWARWLNDSWAVWGQRYLKDGTKVGKNFLISQTNLSVKMEENIVSPDVKLNNNLIYTTWVDNRAGETSFDIWANIIGWEDLVSIVDDQLINIPDEFNLYPNYPNPFNPTTTISYDLPNPVQITLKVYDSIGREVATLYNGVQQAGNYNVSFNAYNLASGIYFYQLRAGNFISTKKMLLIK
jgi:hypothetical protein